MSPERIAEIEAREQAAREWPWRVEGVFSDGGLVLARTRSWPTTEHEDHAAVMTRARQDIPDLLAEVKRLRLREHTPRGDALNEAAALIEDETGNVELAQRVRALA